MTLLPTRANFISGALPHIGRSWGLTRNVPHPNKYIGMLPEYKNWIFLEEEALSLKGKWATVFEKPEQPLDLEIGCGNGFFFAHYVGQNPGRNVLGMELKYKPLVQTVRRIKTKNQSNGRGIRFHAGYADHIFGSGEIDNVFIYFPDPWPKKRQTKNRLLNLEFLHKLYGLQKPDSFVDFKTDSEDYFDAFTTILEKGPYERVRFTKDLHHSEWADENFRTSFENIFLKKKQPIFYLRLQKN